jgi:PP-loop family
MFIVTISVFITLIMIALSKSLLNRSTRRRRHFCFAGYKGAGFKDAGFKDVTNLLSIESKILHYLSNECKVSANSFVLLSVSGGLDSMAMLHILQSISVKYLPMNLEVISFNHKLRSESDEEVDNLYILCAYDATMTIQ